PREPGRQVARFGRWCRPSSLAHLLGLLRVLGVLDRLLGVADRDLVLLDLLDQCVGVFLPDQRWSFLLYSLHPFCASDAGSHLLGGLSCRLASGLLVGVRSGQLEHVRLGGRLLAFPLSL